jgi:hypothetical protein
MNTTVTPYNLVNNCRRFVETCCLSIYRKDGDGIFHYTDNENCVNNERDAFGHSQPDMSGCNAKGCKSFFEEQMMEVLVGCHYA